MAYTLRYWYNNKLTDGKVIRLEIYKKDSTSAAMEIGDVVQGISLNIDGGEDNIDAPIVSTSLVMTFCDAYDHPEAEVKKCGNWAEFYTPDATLWKVVLLCKDNGSSSFRTLWGGYVTPDSYEEDLTYRGSVTIVARDNIGHMADFPFDAEGDSYGTISFREIIEGAWAKIESPMSLVFHDEWMQTEGVSALDTRMNVTAFEDKSWHEAVESVLYAYGAVLRFIGDNKVKVSPLRYIPNYGGSVTHSEPVFMTGATRMLTPAAKRIEETASYELEADLQPLVKPSDFSGNTHALDAENDIFGYSLSNTEEGKGWLNTQADKAIYFDPSAYNIQDADSANEVKNQMYLVANIGYNNVAEYSRNILAHDAQVKISFGTGLMRKPYLDANGRPAGGYYLVPRAGKITAAHYGISVTQNGIKQYLTAQGEWTTTRAFMSLTDENGFTELDIPVDLSEYTGTILLKVEIGGIDATIPYVQIAALSFGANEADSLLQTNRVNTNYNEENNVIISRDPALAPAYNTTFLPAVIKNGIFYAEGLAYKSTKAWAFAGDTPQQMAVYNHLQLLAYYAKPNNVIEGSIVNGDVSRFAHIWQFEGKEHILVSGRYNFINGYIEGAILREFARYENLWGSTGGTQLPATEVNGTTNKEAGASSTSNATTYDHKTEVNINFGGGGSSYLADLLDVDVTASVADSVLYFNGNTWVDKSFQLLLTELKQIGDWFYKTEDGKSIGTKLNLFSEGTLASKGMGESGTGSSDLVIMESWEQYDSTLAQVLGAALGIELHNRLTAVENGQVDIDLSPYATIEFVQQAISDLIGGADAAYDTLVEIQNILQGNEAGIETLLTEIASKASKTELKEVSDIVTELGETISDHEERIAELEEGGGMFEWIVDEDGTRRIKTVYDFYSDGTIASGGKGTQGEEAGEGTVVAVSVNGETYEAEDGIVTIPDYPTKTAYDSKVSDLESKDSEHEQVLDELAASNELLTEKVGAAEGNIKTHEERLTEIEKITSLFGIDEDGIYTDENFRSTGTLASGGIGQQGEAEGGGIQAISLNGETYDDADGDGVIELPELPTMQDLQDVREGAELGKTALQEVPSEYITEDELNAALRGVGGSGVGSYAVCLDSDDDGNLIELTEAQKAQNKAAYDAYMAVPIENKPVLSISGGGGVLFVSEETNEETGIVSLALGYSTQFIFGLGSFSTYIATVCMDADLMPDGSIENYSISFGVTVDMDSFKTINGESIIGVGDITIEGGSGSSIEDIEEIRAGAALGKTALQEVPSEYITETELASKTDTAMSNTSTNAVQNKVIKAYVDGLVGDINSMLDTINGEEI